MPAEGLEEEEPTCVEEEEDEAACAEVMGAFFFRIALAILITQVEVRGCRQEGGREGDRW